MEIASIGHRNCNSERMQYAGVELFASLSFVYCDLCLHTPYFCPCPSIEKNCFCDLCNTFEIFVFVFL